MYASSVGEAHRESDVSKLKKSYQVYLDRGYGGLFPDIFEITPLRPLENVERMMFM